MAAENIGALVPTKIPGYADAADIQAALRLYHYGSYTYDINQTNPASLVSPSIAYTLNNLQDQIDTVEGTVIQSTVFAAKGDLLSASANDTPLIISAGSNNQFLVVNSATATGLQWTNSLVGPSVTGLILSDSSIIFEGSVSDDFETTLTVVNPTADRTITIPDITGTIVTTGDTSTVTNTMLAGSIANNKLSNSTISGVSLGSNLNALTIGTGLTGTSYNGSSAVTVAIDSTVVTLSGTQTLTNKTLTTPIISSISNTGTLTLPSSTDTLVGRATTDTLTNKSIALGSNTVTGTIAQFNTALTDADFATIAGTETLTNKTLTSPTISNAVFTGQVSGLEIAFNQSIVFEGTTADDNELTLSAGNPTADRTVTLPDATDTLVGRATTDTLSSKTIALGSNTVSGTIAQFNTALTDADFATIAGSETLTNKTIALGSNTVSGTIAQFNTALTDADFATIAGTETLTNKTLTLPTIGTTGARFSGATSGTITLIATATAGANTITLPATTGNVVTTGDSGTITSTMIADGTIVNGDISVSAAIAVSKLAASTISGITLGSNLNTLTIGTGLSGTSYNGSSAVTVAIDSTVATLTGSQTLSNKTLSSATLTGTVTAGGGVGTNGQVLTSTGTGVQWSTAAAGYTAPTIGSTLISSGATITTIAGLTLTAPVINLSTNAQTGTTYIPVLADNGKLVTLSNASAITVTVPTNTAVSYATGAQINLLQLGAGQVTVVGDTGVTVYGTPGLKFRSQYSAATLIKLDTNTWLLTGDLSA